MKPITLPQLKKINVIVSQRKIDAETKASMVFGFSKGRATSTKDLLADEAVLMIKHLEATDPNQRAAERMRKKFLHMAHSMGWQIKRGDNKIVVDMERVDRWCKTYSYGKKPLNNYTYKELPKLLSQFESVYKKFIHQL